MYWNWDTSFILLFYLLEWILSLTLTSAKGTKRFTYLGDSSERKEAIKNLAFGFIWLILTCLIIENTLPKLENNFSWVERIRSFITYSDLGIAQGYLLIPILILNGVMVYRQQFVATELYKKLSMKDITFGANLQGIILFGSAIFLAVISLFVKYPPELILFATIGGTSLYKVVRN